MSTKIAVTLRSGETNQTVYVGATRHVESMLSEINAEVILEIGSHLVTTYLSWDGPIAMIHIEPQKDASRAARLAVTQVIQLGYALKFK